MNVTTGEVIAERIARNDSATFISVPSLLDQSIPPGLDIHLIMDNGITAFTIRHNKRARPYKWSYDATPSTPATSNATPSPNHRPPSPKPHDSNAQSPRPSQELVRGCTREREQ